MPRPIRARLHVESLEVRENPAAGPVESFDQAVSPGLPAGWSEWSNDGSDGFGTAVGQGVGGSVALVSTGTSRTAGLAWDGDARSADTGAAVSVKLDTLIPAQVVVRGTDLGTSAPSYIAAVITRGVTLQVWEVVGGAPHMLGSVVSLSSSYFSGDWVRVSVVPTGNTVAVQVVRQDTGQYLNGQGKWQADAVNALSVKATLTTGGEVGVGRAARYAGAVAFDNFQPLPPATPPPPPPPPVISVIESFDTTKAGAIPAGWSSWTSTATGAFAAGTSRAESPANGLTSNGGSTSAARAWSNTVLPPDVTASAAVYLDSLIPAQLFARGTNLDTATPTYYGVVVTRGLQARLVKVVNGAETTLASITSSAYFSSQWLRVTLTAQGDHLQVMVYRPDTRQWLGSDGVFTDSPDFALDLHDGSIGGSGLAGVGRAAQFSGPVTFDDFTAETAGAVTGPVPTVTRVTGSGAVTGDVTFRATVPGTVTRVEFRVDNLLRATAATNPAEWTFDSTSVANGTHTLTVRAFDSAGNFGSTDFTFTVNNPNADPVPKPTIPQHYPNIRIAELAYTGTPVTGAFEQTLLRNSVDLVVPNPQYLSTIQATSPDTPQLIYSNVSNLYGGLLADWLQYADQAGVSRELAFYHVSKATPFSGSSSSSQPVTWFWGTYQFTTSPATATDVTSAARGGRNFNVNFGATGTSTAVGYLEKFREMNITLATQPAAGWGGVWEYAAAVDTNGNPTAWKPLKLNQDGTAGLTKSGTITFDPPADWVTASVGGSTRQYYVRFRVTSGTAAQAPQLKTVFGRDYVNAAGGSAGVIPAFDHAADKNHDGYLDDAEYATRAAGMDARFVYESRLFYPFYGQMRFVTDPSSSAVRRWAADYHVRLLAANPLADGIFMDNATGKVPFPGVSVLEPTTTYSSDSGALVAGVNRAVAPKWVMANTAGGGTNAGAIASGSAAVFEEFLLRPLTANWSQVGDVANLVADRLDATGSPYVVLDSSPDGGSPTDPRTQLATLAYYYLVGDPNRTMLMFYGGSNPSSSWVNHWSQAATVNVGKPTGAMQVFASGTDPLSPSLTYKVFSRTYDNGLVLYKPLSYAQGVGTGTINPQTATTHQLGGKYRQVNADGTLGPVISQVTLRNGEGAVLVKA
jgi:hypothetical protein